MSIASEITRLQQAKAAMKAAIEAKGVTVGDVTLDEYADLIEQISGGGGGDESLKELINRSITSVTVPSGVTTIGNSAFKYCSNLTSVTLPNGVTSIAASAFERCGKLESINIPSGVTTLGNDAFHYCSKLTTLVLPETVTSIGSYAFSDMSTLVSITLSTNLTSIGNQCFMNCGSLTSIDIPAGPSALNTNFFTGCNKLATIICRRQTPPTVSANTFGNSSNNYTGRGVASGKKLYVPKNCSSAYNTSYWASVLLDSSKCNFTIHELDEDGNIPT